MLLSQANKQLTRKFGSESHLISAGMMPVMPVSPDQVDSVSRPSMMKQKSCLVLTPPLAMVDDGFDSSSQDVSAFGCCICLFVYSVCAVFVV